MQRTASIGVMGIVVLGLVSYVQHSNWVTSEAYSSPSIVLISGWGPHRVVLDDFREAYYWWVGLLLVHEGGGGRPCANVCVCVQGGGAGDHR